MAEAAVAGLSYKKRVKALFPEVKASQVETRKSLYEEFGLLYVPKSSDTLHLTAVGRQLFELLGPDPPTNPSDELRRQVDSLLCWAMSQTQINRPQSLGSPEITAAERVNCDIRPYAGFWQAMFELDGTITFDEFSRVLAHVQRVDEFPTAIQTIRSSRNSGVLPAAPAKSGNFGIYWRAHLTLAGLVLQITDGRFTFAPERDNILKSILQFQMGCEGDDVSAVLRARTWTDITNYYEFAGQACPPFISSGQAAVVSYGGSGVVLLKGYELQKDASGYFVDTGIELCPLKIGMPCFHSSEVSRMLRVDRKTSTVGNAIRIRLGLGRPIKDSSQLLQLWGEP